jgi:hypothetical protein
MLEERKNLLKNMGQKENRASAKDAERAKETEVHIERIRGMLLARDTS